MKTLIYRIAHKDDVYQGPFIGTSQIIEGWELSIDLMNLSLVDTGNGWLYGFSEDQFNLFFSPKMIKSLAKDDYIVYEIEVEEYLDHGDQVTFNADTATIVG